MNFQHSEDRRMLADSLGRFVREQYGFEARNRIAQSKEGLSRPMWSQFAELGVIGALFAEAQGGFGGSGFDIAVVFEELGRGLVVEPLLATLMAGTALAVAGGEAQHALLAEMIGGDQLVAFAHGEPMAGYELSHVEATARRNGDGWVLDGTKALVDGGEQADAFVVSARTAGAADAEDGLTLFVVPAKAGGVSLRGYPLIDGGRAAELTLRGVELGSDARIGTEGQAWPAIEQAVGRGILALCAESVGAMDAAKDATLEYLRTRRQFGVPIGSFQALQHRMADLLLEVEQARSAVINAAAAVDGDDRLAREKALSAAKYSIGRIGTLVAEECIQLHGGIGMTWELPLAHYAKRLVMIDHQLGDEDHHLARYIALGRAAA